MANYIVDEHDQAFVLFEQLKMDELTKFPKYADFSREIFDMTLAEARKFAVEVLEPTVEAGEKEGCPSSTGRSMCRRPITSPTGSLRRADGSLMSQDPAVGGQGMPYLLYVATREYFNCNCAFNAYPGLAEGVAQLIAAFGTDGQKSRYLEKLLSGRWGGTMVLTEPNAGSDVGVADDHRQEKSPTAPTLISGTKIFITGGDQDLTENIVHPVLARIEGAPAGTKGISLFLVPKYLVNDDGTLGRRNDYTIGGLEKKMGFKGSATCLMNFGDNGELPRRAPRRGEPGDAHHVRHDERGADRRGPHGPCGGLPRLPLFGQVRKGAAPGGEPHQLPGPDGAEGADHQPPGRAQDAPVDEVDRRGPEGDDLLHGLRRGPGPGGPNRRGARKVARVRGALDPGGQVPRLGHGFFRGQPGGPGLRRVRLHRRLPDGADPAGLPDRPAV